jgi:large subunit ribosomal protein L31e
MADKLEREYIIPLRQTLLKKPKYKRTGLAVKRIKQFIAKHMKVEDRDLNKVKIDPYLNNDVWFRGRTQPPARIKVKAIKDKGIVTVTFAETPEIVKFEKAKNERRHKAPEVEKAKAPAKEEEKKDEAPKEEVKEEKEKETSAAIQKEAQAKSESNVAKHTAKQPKAAQVRQRKQLSK